MKMKDEKEWMLQAESDIKSAKSLLDGGHYIQCVFMCHLSIEKALKALYYFNIGKEPPRTHNLNLLVEETNLTPPREHLKLINRLATASVPTRYPQDLRRMSANYTKSGTAQILSNSNEVIKWIKSLLTK